MPSTGRGAPIRGRFGDLATRTQEFTDDLVSGVEDTLFHVDFDAGGKVASTSECVQDED